MKKKPAVLMFFSCLLMTVFAHAQQSGGFKMSNHYKIPSPGGWDYIAVSGGKIYVSHGTQVNILDEQTGDSIGVIPNTTGVHGIAFNTELGKGYTSNGRLNTVTVFDLKSNAVLQQIAVGQNPDAIMYDPFSKKIITCNGRSHDLSVIDPVSEQVVATIALEGKPETAVSDEQGKIFVNIEDKNAICAVNISTGKVKSTWSIAPGDGPTGLAIDLNTHRLFAGCDKLLMVIDAQTGKIVSKVAIGDGCDGVAFDNGLKYIFASCGEGKLSIIEEQSANAFKSIQTVETKRSARTLAVDEKAHLVFLPAADLGKSAAGERPPMVPGSFQVIVVSR